VGLGENRPTGETWKGREAGVIRRKKEAAKGKKRPDQKGRTAEKNWSGV